MRQSATMWENNLGCLYIYNMQTFSLLGMLSRRKLGQQQSSFSIQKKNRNKRNGWLYTNAKFDIGINMCCYCCRIWLIYSNGWLLIFTISLFQLYIYIYTSFVWWMCERLMFRCEQPSRRLCMSLVRDRWPARVPSKYKPNESVVLTKIDCVCYDFRNIQLFLRHNFYTK